MMAFETELSKTTTSLAKSFYETNGFVVLRNAIPKSLIDNTHQALLRAIESNTISNATRDLHILPNGEASSAHNLTKYIPEYNSLIELRNIRELIELIYGELSTTLFNSSYFAKPKLVGLETKAHQDNAFFCMSPAEVATCWLPLTYANKKNGTLYYLPGSHNLGDLPHEPEGNLGASMCLSAKTIKDVLLKYQKTYIELEAGDCVIHNALVIHGSDENKSNFDRNAFNFSIGSIRAERDEDLFNKYQKNLSDFLKRKKQ